MPEHTNAEQAFAMDAYARGLALLEAGEFDEAKRVLAPLSEADGLPARFLLRYVEEQLGRQNRRRSSDQPEGRYRGVIRIDAK
jgi:hypothetical protein